MLIFRYRSFITVSEYFVANISLHILFRSSKLHIRVFSQLSVNLQIPITLYAGRLWTGKMIKIFFQTNSYNFFHTTPKIRMNGVNLGKLFAGTSNGHLRLKKGAENPREPAGV